MAGSFSDYLEAALLAHVLGRTTFTVPATVYVGLFTVAPSDIGGGTEVTGGSYARTAVTNNTTNFPAPTGTNPTTSQNGTAVTFVKATADWGTVVAFGLFDDPNAGNLLIWGDVSTNQSIPNGVTASFDVNALTVTLN